VDALPRQDVVGVGELALLRGGNSLSVTQRSVAVGFLKRRVVLPVTQPREGEAQQGTHQHVCTEGRGEDEERV